MTGSANVTSIDALKRFRLAMQEFDDDARDALTQLTLEMRRAMDWLDVDRAQYWPREVRLASNQVAEARVNLERCQISITPGDEGSCYDEKKALEKAKRRLQLAQEKVQTVKRWRMKAKHQADEFQMQITKLTSILDTDLPRAIAALQRMAKALDQYAQRDSQSPSGSTSQADSPKQKLPCSDDDAAASELKP